MMYKREYWWMKPLKTLGLVLYTICAGVGFGFILSALLSAIG